MIAGYRDSRKYVECCPDILEYVECCPDILEYVGCCPDILEYVECCPDILEYVECCPDILELYVLQAWLEHSGYASQFLISFNVRIHRKSRIY